MDFNKDEWKGVTLSKQAVSTLMVALQKCLIEQSDIVPILNDMRWARNIDTDELHVLNPPTLTLDFSNLEDEEG